MAYYDEQNFGVDPEGSPRRRSRISSFAADGRGNFSSTFSGPETGGAMVRRDWGADFDPQAQVGADFDGIAQRAAAVKRHNAQLGNWSLNAAMKSALGNGGRVPQNQVDLLTRNLGMDGRNRAVWRAGFLQNGDFAVDVAERGQNGGVSTTTMRIPRADQRRMMLDAPGVWGDAGVARYRELGDALSSTLGRSELGDPEAYSGALQRYRSGQSARQAQAAKAQRMQLVKSIIDQVSKDGDRRNPEQDVRFRLLTDKNLGPVYRRGKPVLNEKGEQELDDEGNPKFEEATPEEVKAKLEHDVALVMGGQQGRDDDFDRRAQWAMSVINQIYPQQPPRAKEMQDRQMEDALDAQRRSEVTRFPQRYIRYRDASGREVAGNGYVTNDGRVYDANGYEIEGATAARSPYDNALPPIRALDGGAAQGSQSAQGWTPGHDLRNDGKTFKGTGWLGVLRLPNGGVASEYTIGVNIDGKEIDIPTLVPTLTKKEQDLMVNDIIPNHKDVPDSIVKKAVDFAKMRLANGRSVFANDGMPQGQSAQTPASATQDGVQTPEQLAQAALAKRRSSAGSPAETPVAVAEQPAEKPAYQQNFEQTIDPATGVADPVRAAEPMPAQASAPVEQKPKIAAPQPTRKDDVSLFVNSGGQYDEDGAGYRTITLGNYDYLPDEDRKAHPMITRESKDNDIDLEVLQKLQEKANSLKAAFDKRRSAEEAAYAKSIASKRYTVTRRERMIQAHMDEWDEANDPRIVNNRDVLNGGSGPMRLF